MDWGHFLELLDDYLENSLDEERQGEFETILREDAAARALFWKYMHQEVSIQRIEREARGQSLAREEETRSTLSAAAARRPRWRGWMALAASFVIAGLIGLGLYVARNRPARPEGPLVLAGSDAVVRRVDGREERIEPGMRLNAHDRIVVAEDGSADIRFPDGILRLGPDTILGLSGESEKLSLMQGRIRAEWTTNGLAVDTPTAEAAMVDGPGNLVIVAAPTSTRLEVESGGGTLRRKSDNRQTTVSAGAYAVAAPGLAPAARPIPAPNREEATPVLLATWLGGAADNAVVAASVQPDGSILVAGNFPNADLELWRPDRQFGTGKAMILRLSGDASRLLAVRRCEGSIEAVDVDESGNVRVTGSFGSTKMDATLRQTVWTAAVQGKRIAAGPDGSTVLLSGSSVTILDQQGRVQRSWSISDRVVHDLICDARRGSIFVAGSSIDDRAGPLVPFIYAYDMQGRKQWTAYDWPRKEVAGQQLGAASEALHLALGQDGQLYVAGESHGGNTVWARQSDDLDRPLLQPRGDRFQSPYNLGSQFLTFVGRLDPRSGRTDMGTMLLGRRDRDVGVSMRPRTLAVDAEGRIYVGGWSGATPPVSRGAFGLQGEGGGAFLSVFDRDFNRLYSARLCGGTTRAIAIGSGAVVVAGDGRDGLTPVRPFQTEPNGDDAWLIVFRKAPGIEYDTPITPLQRR